MIYIARCSNITSAVVCASVEEINNFLKNPLLIKASTPFFNYKNMRLEDPLSYTMETVAYEYLPSNFTDDGNAQIEFNWMEMSFMQNHVQRNNELI